MTGSSPGRVDARDLLKIIDTSACLSRPGSPPADGVQVAEGLRVRAHEAGLAVGQSFVPAEVADERLRPAKARPGHGREKMVLNLVVQAAEGKVGEPASADVAGGQDLTAEEVVLVRGLQDRHALVVRGERGSQVEA